MNRTACAATMLCAGLLIGSTGVPTAAAENGDTHITGFGRIATIDCNNGTLLVNGTANVITALGSCWAVTIQGSSNTVIADNVVNDITVYGWDQTALYKTGNPAVIDRGRELGMTNTINRVPA